MCISRLSFIFWVKVVLNRTVVVDSDWRFDNLCGSHLQSQKNLSPIQDYVHPDDQTQPTYENNDSWVQTFHNTMYINEKQFELSRSIEYTVFNLPVT